ncbi:MAG: hypothetical protein ACRD4E_02380, partial [Bryobacteraceae bacterium]
MPHRCFGRIGAILIGLTAVAAMFSQPTPFGSPRLEAWELARDLIKESGTRRGIPKFVDWATAREIFPCGGHAPAAEVLTRNLLDESFHYSPDVAARLCAPLSPATGSVPLDAALAAWEKSKSKPSITLQFPDGAHLAAA